MENQNLIGLSVTTGTYGAIVDEVFNLSIRKTGAYVCLLNVHMLVLAYYDTRFKEVLEQANLTTPDGVPVTWALRLFCGIKQERVAGMDVLPDLLSKAESSKKAVFFYGGTERM